MPTRVERNIIAHIIERIDEDGASPSVRALQRHLGHRSPSTTHFIIHRMIERGLLELAGPARSIVPTQAGLEAAGRV